MRLQDMSLSYDLMKITKKYWQLYGWHLKPICVQGQNFVLIIVLKNTTVIAPHVAVFRFDENEKKYWQLYGWQL